MIKDRLQFLLIVSLAVFLGGCGHYQLGRPGTLPFETLHVQPARNESYAPQAQALLTDQVSNEFIRRGRTQLQDKEDADAQLDMVIVDYRRNVAATQRSDSGLAQSFSLSLAVECTLTNNDTGEVIFENRRISASTNAFIDDGFQPAEYQAMSALTRQLAMNVVDYVESSW